MVNPISGGSLREAELPGVAEVAWRGPAARPESPFMQGLGRLRRSTTAVIGAAVVGLLLVVAIFADVLAPESPTASDPLGTDQLGRDMLSRVIHGTRISLIVGVSSVLLALFVGVPFGMIAGYYGGRVDTLVMRVMDLILAFPIYLLAIILMVIFTPTAGLIGTIKVTGAIAIVRIPIYARLVRPRHLRDRARLQPLRRRPARRARPAAQVESLPGGHGGPFPPAESSRSVGEIATESAASRRTSPRLRPGGGPIPPPSRRLSATRVAAGGPESRTRRRPARPS
jgi:hypothetical protein